MEKNSSYLIWKKIQDPTNANEFLVGRTLARELHQKNFKDIAIQYIFIKPKDAERVFKIIPSSWESIKGVGIDLGGGIGCMSSLVAKKDEVEKVYCVEYTEDLVKLCQPVMKRAILGERADKVISVVGDFDNLELADNSLDFAISWDSIHHSHDPVKTLKECRRVLKSGRRLIMVDRAHNNSTPDSEIDRMHNIVYDKDYLRRNYLDENMIMTRIENGEHEWRFNEWENFFQQSGLKLLEMVILKTDTKENRELKNDRNLEEIFLPFKIGGFGHRKIGFVLEAMKD